MLSDSLLLLTNTCLRSVASGRMRIAVLWVATWAASAATAAPACSWDHPGVNPFMGDVPAAVDRYVDIPAEVRGRLKRRMAVRQYDDVAEIRRDRIEGTHRYAPELREMHFGGGRVCATVSRAGWTDRMVERGLVYCEDGHCIIVPTVCRNVSRLTRIDEPVAVAGGGQSAPESPPQTGTALPPPEPFEYEPPAAGPVPQVGGPGEAKPSFAELARPPWPRFDNRPPVDYQPWVPVGPGPWAPPVVPPPIPEPGTVVLWALGIGGLALAVRRTRRRDPEDSVPSV